MSVSSYQDLVVWQKGMDLAVLCYRLTRPFPAEERYGMTSQIRRAATSIPANIAEGWGRGTTAEYIHFLRIAQGSIKELETLLLLCQRVDLLEPLDRGASPRPADRDLTDDDFPDWFFAAQAEVGPHALVPPYSLLAAHSLLSLRVADISCGSGHILLAAARRIATALATPCAPARSSRRRPPSAPRCAM
jgi:four helix bundle protein